MNRRTDRRTDGQFEAPLSVRADSQRDAEGTQRKKKKKTDRQKKKKVTDPYVYQNLEAVLLFSIFKHAHRHQNGKTMKKVLILLLVGSHCADISTSPPQNRMALSFFLNFRSLGSMFLYFLSSGEGAGAGQVEKRINTNVPKTPNISEERCPRHDFQTNVAKLKAFFLFVSMCFSSDVWLQL